MLPTVTYLYIFMKKNLFMLKLYHMLCKKMFFLIMVNQIALWKSFSGNILLLNAFHDLNYNIYYQLYLKI